MRRRPATTTAFVRACVGYMHAEMIVGEAELVRGVREHTGGRGTPERDRAA